MHGLGSPEGEEGAPGGLLRHKRSPECPQVSASKWQMAEPLIHSGEDWALHVTSAPFPLVTEWPHPVALSAPEQEVN